MNAKLVFVRKLLINFILLAFLLTGEASGVPANPRPFDFEQSDGSRITILLHGDEFVNWRKSADGFTLLFNADGLLEYAVADENGDLVLSGIRARNEEERTDEERTFLKSVPKNLRFSTAQISQRNQNRAARESEYAAPKTRIISSGSVRVPVILVGFWGKPFTKTKDDFEHLLNGIDYTDDGRIPGSLREYFLANSVGQLDVQFDIFGPFNLPGHVSYYQIRDNDVGCHTAGGQSRQMVISAVDSARKYGANFADYDYESTGTVPAVHIIFAGHCTAAGAHPCNSIWSHKSGLNIIRNGKTLSVYSTSPEFRGANSSIIAGIGTMAHELGHALLGLDDYYDTDYESGGLAVDLDYWCLMASGSHFDDSPSLLSAYPRVALGWMDEITLSHPQDVTVFNPQNPAFFPVAYRINTNTPNEYFLIENRQQTGWDAQIPNGGLLVYHVDKNNAGWNNNKINAFASRRGYYVKQAGCPLADGCGDDRENDVFPRGQFDSFTDFSIPNSRSWAEINTQKPVTDITHDLETGTVFFSFMDPQFAPTSVRDKVKNNLTAPFPQNLVSDKLEFSPDLGVTKVVIFDALGNVVYNSESGSSTGSPTASRGTAAVWDLRNSAGRFVANGTYLVIVEAMDKNGKLKRYSGRIGVKR